MPVPEPGLMMLVPKVVKPLVAVEGLEDPTPLPAPAPALNDDPGLVPCASEVNP